MYIIMCIIIYAYNYIISYNNYIYIYMCVFIYVFMCVVIIHGDYKNVILVAMMTN